MNNVVCSLLLCFLTCHIFLCLCVCLVCSQQQIMRDRWMNVGYEEEELKPYIEPQPDYKDPRRTGTYGIFHPILISTVVRMLLSTLTTAHSLTTYCHSCINQKMIFFFICVRPDIMLQMGFSQEEIQDSLVNQKYNDVMATYLLLDYRNSEVHCSFLPLIHTIHICLS